MSEEVTVDKSMGICGR